VPLRPPHHPPRPHHYLVTLTPMTLSSSLVTPVPPSSRHRLSRLTVVYLISSSPSHHCFHRASATATSPVIVCASPSLVVVRPAALSSLLSRHLPRLTIMGPTSLVVVHLGRTVTPSPLIIHSSLTSPPLCRHPHYLCTSPT
jgi:Mn2+/Fe2+ NRAMP family transporter